MTYKINFYQEQPFTPKMAEDLFFACFGKQLQEGYWNWRFLQNPLKAPPQIAYIQTSDGLVAYYAVSPIRVITPQQTCIKAALSMMTMTHPSYQGQGLFKTLALALYEQLKLSGFDCVIGFANSNSHYGFRKYLGWQDITPIVPLALSKENININVTRSNSLPVDYEITYPISSKELQTQYLESNLHNYWRIERNQAYLNWRILQNPEQTYGAIKLTTENACKLIIYKHYQTSIDIVDILGGHINQHFATALIKALAASSKNELSSIYLWSNLASDEYLDLEKVGFRPTTFNSYFGIIPLNLNTASIQNANQAKSWHLRPIDSDVF